MCNFEQRISPLKNSFTPTFGFGGMLATRLKNMDLEIEEKHPKVAHRPGGGHQEFGENRLPAVSRPKNAENWFNGRRFCQYR